MTEDVNIDATLAPKSDQLDAIELSQPRTITIRAVTAGSGEQPINVYFDGDDGRPFRPSKTVRRILREAWGNRGSDWVGKSATLYNDKTVKYGGIEVGGVRVSHVSHIDSPITMMLPVTRGKFAKYHIQPLVVRSMPAEAFTDVLKRMAAATTEDALLAIAKEIGEDASDQQREQARAAFRARRAELNTNQEEAQ
jgi:hypothetical protein